MVYEYFYFQRQLSQCQCVLIEADRPSEREKLKKKGECGSCTLRIWTLLTIEWLIALVENDTVSSRYYLVEFVIEKLWTWCDVIMQGKTEAIPVDRGRVEDIHTWHAHHDSWGTITAAREGICHNRWKINKCSPPITFTQLFQVSTFQAYLLQLKIEEASWRLRSGDLGIPPNPEDRWHFRIIALLQSW